MSIYKKIAELKKEVGAISKEETNPFFKSKYFDINGLIKHLDPLLSKNGLVILQPINDGKVESILVDLESGESIQSSLELPVFDDPQKLGSCITYYRRYTLQSLLGLQAEDDDANSASKGGIAKPKKAWLNKGTKEWSAAIDYVKNGGKVEDIIKKYAISKENLNELKSL
jgi:hypothetical protein